MKSVELFAGAGGLAMGANLAGFEAQAVIEWDKWACDTIRENQKRENPLVRDWKLIEGDVRHFDYSSLKCDIDLVAGGPPCQPFSMGGKHRAFNDHRDMFPTAVNVVRKLRPRAFVFENVKGLTRDSFSNYLQYIKLQLSYPETVCKTNESWNEHFSRLEKLKTSGGGSGLQYNVVNQVLNAADFGVPQKRERVFIVGFRQDQKVEWSFPLPTHSLDSLLTDKWISGEYWDRHKFSRKARPQLPARMAGRIERLRGANAQSAMIHHPWITVRDALIDISDPQKERNKQLYHNHQYQPGAKAYKGHTGSPLDLPAKTLKAGDHGVPGGENMMIKDDGTVRYFTVRESARLQTFPDGYIFHGAWSETMRQLGNAVPVSLAQVVTSSIAQKLLEAETRNIARQIRALKRA